MIKNNVIRWVILIIGIVLAINLILFYFFPTNVPVLNFTMIRVGIIAVINKGYIAINCLWIILTIMASVSVKKNRIVLPILVMAIYLFDLVWVTSLFIADLIDNYFNLYIVPSGVVDIIVLIIFTVYFTERFKVKRQNRTSAMSHRISTGNSMEQES